MDGEFKLWRQIHGKGAFAHVRVSVVTSADDREVSIADSVESFPDWKRAAQDACTGCLRILRAHGAANSTTRVIVTSLITTDVDTTPDAVEAAAVLAVANALGLHGEFVLQYEKRWHVEWSSKQVRVV
jgi:hypothetical protein